jgi:hypothetical protein
VRIDVRLDEVVLHALEKEPDRRYQHASEVKCDVDSIAAGSRADGLGFPRPRGAAWLRPIVVVARWTARVLGLLGFLFVLMFVLAEGFPPFWQQPPAVQVELAAMVTMLVGLLLGWKSELWGALLIVAGWLVFLIAEHGWPPMPFTCFLLAAVLYAASWWNRARGRPAGQARPAAVSHVAPVHGDPTPPTADDQTLDLARRDVKGPSLGLVATSVLNWLTIFALAPYMAAYRDARLDVFLLVLAILAVGSGVILVGALKMQRLESLLLARLASVLAMFIGPGYLIGWPMGIWSLVVLSRREVVAGFRQRRQSPQDLPGSPP